jgi:hypothetical protein
LVLVEYSISIGLQLNTDKMGEEKIKFNPCLSIKKKSVWQISIIQLYKLQTFCIFSFEFAS